MGLLGLNDWLTLLIQIPLGAVIYIGGSVIFKIESFRYLLDTVKSYRRKGKKEDDPEAAE